MMIGFEVSLGYNSPYCGAPGRGGWAREDTLWKVCFNRPT